jgi:predicted dehydrogenase
MKFTEDRRSFLSKSGRAALAVAALGAAAARPKSARGAGANDRLRVAVIGCGGQGQGAHIRGFPRDQNAQIVYVCDPDQKRREEAARHAGAAKPLDDFRRALDDPQVDAVTIATPDHWHVPAALLAMDAGKHVYVEKPCSHNVREGRMLVETAARTGRIVQHGTQARSTPGFQEAVQMLHEGAIGEVLIARVWNIQRRNDIGHAQPSDPPTGFDYDLWLGPAPFVPFQANRHHYTWHWWYDFGTGDLGNDGVHELDMARWGLGVSSQPSKVSAVGGKYFFDDDQQFPDTVTATFEYDETGSKPRQIVFEMRLWSTNYPEGVDNGIEFLGTKGKMFFSRRGKFWLLEERNKRSELAPRSELRWDVSRNLANWLGAIRGDHAAAAPASEAHLSASLCHLANLSVRLGRSFQLDPVQETIMGDDQASAMLGRAYRSDHWATPRG